MNLLGFTQPSYMLPFDHRGSFQSKMFGWTGALTSDRISEIAAIKRVIYDGFIDEAVPAPARTASLYERFSSRGEGDFADKLVSAMRYQFGGHLKKPADKPEGLHKERNP